MKLIKITKVDDDLLENLCACYNVLSSDDEVIMVYEREWELELEELLVDFVVVTI